MQPYPQAPPTWEATPPPGSYPQPRPPKSTRYPGPPAYHSPPRWGFPALAWRRPSVIHGVDEATPAPVRMRARGTVARAVLWTLVVLSGLAALSEALRYVLLLQGRTRALPRDLVVLSDTAVVTAATMAALGGVAAVAATVRWLFAARRAAAEQAGYAPPRSDWQVVVSLVIPGVNIAVAGSALAELEHAALARPALNRPTPGPLVRWWWIAAAVSGLLFTLTVVWRFRDGVQALADGVILTALTDAAAAVTAALTAVVVSRVTRLLAPLDLRTLPKLRVVKVTADADPARRARPEVHRR